MNNWYNFAIQFFLSGAMLCVGAFTAFVMIKLLDPCQFRFKISSEWKKIILPAFTLAFFIGALHELLTFRYPILIEYFLLLPAIYLFIGMLGMTLRISKMRIFIVHLIAGTLVTKLVKNEKIQEDIMQDLDSE